MASQEFAAPPPAEELKADPVTHKFVWTIQEFSRRCNSGEEMKSDVFTIRNSVSELSQFSQIK
jgi:hypothetical protein